MEAWGFVLVSWSYHLYYVTFHKRKQQHRNSVVASIFKIGEVTAAEVPGQKELLLIVRSRERGNELEVKRELRDNKNTQDSSEQRSQ